MVENSLLPTLVITSGDPAGIGPEITLKALAQFQSDQRFSLVVLGDANWLQFVNKLLGEPCQIKVVESIEKAQPFSAGCVQVLHHPVVNEPMLGTLDVANAAYVVELLKQAHHLATNQSNTAIVTAPVHKGVINDAGIVFTGHTEFFADASRVEKVVMLLASNQMRMALATTHCPLNKVSELLSSESLTQVLSIYVSSLHKQGITKPKITVLGLNPHAGEGGHLGTEEIEVITPVLNKLSHLNATLIGPVSADTAFSKDKMAATDGYLAMFHDQGLPVIKALSFGECTNVTLGLPYIRTSVDHGTALDRAADLNASCDSMRYAIEYALNALNSKSTLSVKPS